MKNLLPLIVLGAASREVTELLGVLQEQALGIVVIETTHLAIGFKLQVWRTSRLVKPCI